MKKLTPLFTALLCVLLVGCNSYRPASKYNTSVNNVMSGATQFYKGDFVELIQTGVEGQVRKRYYDPLAGHRRYLVRFMHYGSTSHWEKWFDHYELKLSAKTRVVSY